MSEAAAVKRNQILSAAPGVFGRYGYKRTSMDQIAQAAGVSRPSIYQYFTGKEDIFRAMGAQMLDSVIDAADAARRAEGTLADRLYGALAVKIDFLVGTVDSQFRSELLAEAGVVASDLMQSFKERYVGVIQALLASAADELDLLDVALPVQDAAVLLADTLTGIAQENAAPEVLHARLRQMVHLTIRGLATVRR